MPDKNITETKGRYLLKKGKKGLTRIVFSRIGLIVFLLLLQLGGFFALLNFVFDKYLPHYLWTTTVFSVIVIIYLINTDIDPTGKITWLILMMIVPFAGAVLLLYTQTDFGHRALKRRVSDLTEQTRGYIPQNRSTWRSFEEEHPGGASLARYIARSGCYPVFDDTGVTYFSSGEEKFAALIPELEKAQHFIFLEYFIICEGLMWSRVLDVLERKVREGVEVRVMYDGTCEFALLPHDYPKRLEALGIKCKTFSPMTPFLSTHYNYRDHRKIAVIDGHTAFTGGINLADEYINHIERFGHWKDAGIMLKGEAVKSFTLMFLQLWNVSEQKPEFNRYLTYSSPRPDNAGGYVLPFADCPLDSDKVGERVYMDVLNRAKRYVHIMSPYLILDGEMETALCFAAERGVDVAIILPGIPDKPIPYALAKTHYKALLKSGVKIYEYTPGFIHSKVFVSDDERAVVGSINLDYRSLYHHFECAAFMMDVPCIPDIEADFRRTVKVCRQVTEDTVKHEKLKYKVTGAVVKWLAPLL